MHLEIIDIGRNLQRSSIPCSIIFHNQSSCSLLSSACLKAATIAHEPSKVHNREASKPEQLHLSDVKQHDNRAKPRSQSEVVITSMNFSKVT